ncbi:MAG TPA: hypothetical protein VFA45_12715 [Actinomycetes bacterium]|nr:hypothetical protein [Actinomycetes bacterium]
MAAVVGLMVGRASSSAIQARTAKASMVASGMSSNLGKISRPSR